MERVAIIRPPESSLPLANSAGDRIGRWSRAIRPLSADRGGEIWWCFTSLGKAGAS